ncbi:MAG: ATP-binding protein [Paludibacteraceae bacterium]|nr:ATP-binding protein [Paludibacteraceae bacterium]
MIDKNTIKLIIAENQRIISKIKLFEREYSFEDGLNYVLIGLRRAGKSYLLYQRMQQLMKNGHSNEEFLYFNFEDDRLIGMQVSDLNTILMSYQEMFDHSPFIFLDEIQVIDGWEKFARRLADQGYRVYITGSNAKMLSSEIATTLGGRFLTKKVFPLSFREMLRANDIDVDDKNYEYKYATSINKLLEEYFYYGGLPEIGNVQDKRSWLNGLYSKIFFGDLISRYSIRNDKAIKFIVQKLAESVKQPVSFSRIVKLVSSIGTKISTDTVIDYLGYMNESWLLIPISNHASKFVEKASNKKYYFIDNGILNLFLTDPSTSLLENIVAVNLYKQYGDDVTFYNDKIEVDFYMPNLKTAVQVSYSIKDEETREREVRALEKISSVVEVDNRYIVTMYDEEVIETKTCRINVVPLWKWLLKHD